LREDKFLNLSSRNTRSLQKREFGSVPGAYSQTNLNFNRGTHFLCECKIFNKIVLLKNIKRKEKNTHIPCYTFTHKFIISDALHLFLWDPSYLLGSFLSPWRTAFICSVDLLSNEFFQSLLIWECFLFSLRLVFQQ